MVMISGLDVLTFVLDHGLVIANTNSPRMGPLIIPKTPKTACWNDMRERYNTKQAITVDETKSGSSNSDAYNNDNDYYDDADDNNNNNNKNNN